MSTEILSAQYVVDQRVKSYAKEHGVRDYMEAMKAVLAEDELLAECYRSDLPYLEASARAYEDEQTTGPTAKAKLGVLINGARLPSNAPDILLMLKVANLTPDLVKSAADERLAERANEAIDALVAPGLKSERFPEMLRQARREYPDLVHAAESGILNETALKEIYFGWFSRD